MSDLSLNAGSYQGGGLGDFKVKTDKNPLKGNQAASDAVNAAKADAGGELVVIKGSGDATVHNVEVEKGKFTKPKPGPSGLVAVDNLAPAGTSPTDKTRLAIDPKIAGALGGDVALLVDEKNNVGLIGGGDKMAAAAKYLDNPDAKKVNAAYTIAGNDAAVDKKIRV